MRVWAREDLQQLISAVWAQRAHSRPVEPLAVNAGDTVADLRDPATLPQLHAQMAEAEGVNTRAELAEGLVRQADRRGRVQVMDVDVPSFR
jgi:hypothetical protein